MNRSTRSWPARWSSSLPRSAGARATASRRTGWAHVIYNCITGCAAFLLLPLYFAGVREFHELPITKSALSVAAGTVVLGAVFLGLPLAIVFLSPFIVFG